ncbi:glycoside hydrolase family 28 protein [Oribacterium sp. WCC10]|uniref:glycoside hydrolase family 28 protein n=1 Tax=Oribacterium sp. WCC10 TaxID=1855343 RepID=UPI0008EBD79B|nr:glycoside hydrolase family 28 protein [Oribacterium sp. WCC10]SFG53839.1 Polygalacturonase [Oribacterium sp. WCC10]
MDFVIRSVFKRSVTIELENDTICYTPEEYIISIDGKEILKTNLNVVSVEGLSPDKEYTITLTDSKGSTEKTFQTEKESVLLDVKAFGAVGDGLHDDTGFLQAAISACPKDGTVYIPEGKYLTRPLFLKSDMTFWVSEGAVILGDTDRSHYPVLPGMTETSDGKGEYNLASWEGNPETSFASLITAIHAENLDIVGKGIIDGNSDKSNWWVDPKVKRTAWRPNAIFLNGCKHVRMQSLTVKNSPCWAIHPYYTDDIGVFNLNIWNPSDSPNTDGFDPESCDGVLILGTKISVGDDCIAIKSGKYYMSERHHKPADHVTVRNSFLERGHGSVTVGSEAAAGAKNVEVSRCIFKETDRGLRIKTRRGRGPHAVYDNIFFHDIIMKDVHMPFTLNMFYFCDPDGHSDYVQDQNERPVDDRTPFIGTIRAENIEATGADECMFVAYGLPERYIDNIIMRNINVSFLPKEIRKPGQTIMMDNFPEMTGKSVYARNVRHFVMENIRIKGCDDSDTELINVTDFDRCNVIYT